MSTPPDQVWLARGPARADSTPPRGSAVEVGGSAREQSSDSRRTAVLTPVSAERFDEYALIAKLGEGGMAQVYLAVSQGPGGFRKLVCVKRLHAHLSRDPAQIELFTQEANLAASLHHPNIVQTNRVGSYRARPFLTMEYLDGQPLSRVLYRLRSQGRHLPPTVAARIVSLALDGLHYAHHASDYAGVTLGIVHRDISPHNLFLTYEGEVKLLDFGIAKSERHSQDETGLVRGKFAYIAPEQARQEEIDGRADVWGMGVTLWESLVGRRLFQGDSEVAILRASLSDEIPFAAEVADHVPEALARIAERALQRNPERRFQTALQFKQALDAWLAGERQDDFRHTLSSCLKELFADRIEERANVLRSSLARLSSESAQVPAPSVSPPSASPSVPPPVPARTMQVLAADPEAAPSAVRARRFKAIVLVAAAIVGGLFAVFGKGVEARGAGREPSVAPALAAAQDLAPVGAPAPALTPAVTVVAHPEVRPRSSRASEQAVSRAANSTPPNTPVVQPAADALTLERVRDPENVVLDVYTSSKRSRPRGGSSAAAATQTPAEQQSHQTPGSVPASARVEDSAPSEQPAAKGRLKLDSTPYALVFLKGQKLGITPIDVELPAGIHTLVLRNPEQNIETSYRVTVPVGESVERRIALE